ncbi:methionyl-tRNA formyltransferase [Undibacterium sp. RuRC25W]|uniref:methionyl-tRNA formyltransferase n=1 Tax=Undibacterium sp. RuRC25W TaxID=3413047 RepID=UPI003BF10ABB
MHFAFAGCDRNLKLFEILIQAGWQPVKLFSVPENNLLSVNKALLALAQQKKIPIQLSRIIPHDLEELKEMGCDALVVGSYNWRIPDWRNSLPFAINFHPAPLPLGRGPYPMVNAILNGYSRWGVTCHKIEREFDTGAILDSEMFDIDDHDTHESLNIKLQMASGRLGLRIALDFDHLWKSAKPQGEGEYWPLFNEEDRTIHFDQSIVEIKRQLRALGHLECIAHVNQQRIRIKAGFAWTESHAYHCGQVVHANGSTIVIACQDGYFAMNEWS